MRGRFVRRTVTRSVRQRPEREWLALGSSAMNSTGATVATTQLLAFESPTLAVGTPLTADPPQDRTVLRLIGSLTWSQATAGNTVHVGLILTDRSWTPVGTTNITADLDKRWLWWREFSMAVGAAWTAETFSDAGGGIHVNDLPVEKDFTRFDITPKVKLEDGKVLSLVIYQNGATAVTCSSRDIRILLQRAGRR